MIGEGGNSMDTTPESIFEEALKLMNGEHHNKELCIPDGCIVLFHYEDGPVGEDAPRRIYLNSGMRATQIMDLCNFVNLKVSYEMFKSHEE